MNRFRLLTSAALFGALVFVGCNKTPDPTPDAGGNPQPRPNAGDPAPDAKADKTQAAKTEAVKRLREIGLAMHNYESTMAEFPAGIVGPKGDFGLSWRVQLLPYLGDDAAKLYAQFDPKEPWDSDTNKKLIAKMPKQFASPGKEAPEGKTYLRSFVGEQAFVPVPFRPLAPRGKAAPPPFPNRPAGTFAFGQKIAGITDGTGNTLMVAEAAEAVEWTKPDELPFYGMVPGPNPPAVPKLGGVFEGGFHGLMCTGEVFFFSDKLKEETLRALISTNGGEVLPAELTRMLFPEVPKRADVPVEVPGVPADATARKTAVASYQKVLKGANDYHDAIGFLPAGVVGPNKAVGLSWRVQVLPYIGEEALYKEFKLTEAWDSDHNKKLLDKMPKAFESPGKAAEKGHTFLRTTSGPGGIIPTTPAGPKGLPPVAIRPDAPAGSAVPSRTVNGIPDGTSNTILLVEAGEAVPWTKPDEVFLPQLGDPFKPGGPPKDAKLPPLGGPFADGFHAVMADGRVTFFKTGYPSGELAKLFCPNDGWVVDPLGEPDKIGYSVPFPPAAPPKGPGKNVESDKKP